MYLWAHLFEYLIGDFWIVASEITVSGLSGGKSQRNRVTWASAYLKESVSNVKPSQASRVH